MTETQKKLHSLATRLSAKIENAYGGTVCVDTTCFIVPIMEKVYEMGFKDGIESVKGADTERMGREEKVFAENTALAMLGKVRTAFLQGVLGCSSYTDLEKHKKVRALVQKIEQTLVDAEVLSNDDRLSKPVENEDSDET